MGVVSRRWMLLESMGVANGCGYKEVYIYIYIDFLTLLILLYLLFFAAASLLFVNFIKCFFVLYTIDWKYIFIHICKDENLVH